MHEKDSPIIKTEVPIRTHNIVANWSYKENDEPDWEDVPVDISQLTMEEQADLIIERLSTPPKRKRFEQEDALKKLSKMIADELDTAMMQELLKGSK